MSTPSPLAGLSAAYYLAKEVPYVSIAVLDSSNSEDVFTATSDRFSPSMLFQACSISKPVAAMAALVLVDQGVLALDDDVNDHLSASWKLPVSPEWPVKVTVRHLLCHGGGLSVRSFPGYPRKTAIGLTDILDGRKPCMTPPVRVTALPGVRPRYSGGGYTVLQKLIQDVTGKSFADAVKELVLRPLGMFAAQYSQPSAKEAAPGFSDLAPVPGGWLEYPEQAAAGLWCTPTDLVMFGRAIQNMAAGQPGPGGQAYPLNKALARLMLSEQLPGYGLGVELAGSGTGKRFGHTGDNEGYCCELSATSARGPVIAIMTNSNLGQKVIRKLLPHIRGLLAWPDATACTIPSGAAPEPPPSATMLALLPSLYGGDYEIRPGVNLHLMGDGWNWTLTLPGQPPLPLEPKSLTWVACPFLPIDITFQVDGSTHRATSLTLQQIGEEGPETITATRV